MASETLKEITQNGESWIKFLNTASNNYKYSFNEQVLIYAQKPNATACADIETWNKKLRRWVNKGAKGIVLLSMENGRNVLRHVFDISDTHSGINKDFKLWEIKPSYENGIIETLENSFGNLEVKSNLAEAIYSASINLVEDNYIDYFSSLGFDEIYNRPIIFNDKYILSHEPVFIPENRDFINIHGHTHNRFVKEDFFLSEYNKSFPKKKVNPKAYINVCVDANDLKIHCLRDLIDL